MKNVLFDTHAHIDLAPNLNEIIMEIEKKQIFTIAVTNLPPLYSRFKERVFSNYIKPALGFHPELIEQYQKYIPQMWNLIEEARYIGEVGLDYKVGISSKLIQRNFFELLIENCHEIGGKILTIHSRGSVDDVLSIIGKQFNSKFILHWYSGNIKNINLAINQGAYFSINLAMTKSQKGIHIINNIPNERLLLESDYPFILNKNKTSYKPTDMFDNVARIAKVKNMEYEEMLNVLNNNFRQVLC